MKQNEMKTGTLLKRFVPYYKKIYESHGHGFILCVAYHHL